MRIATTIIKRRKRAIEDFDHSKFLRSITAACMSVRAHEGEAEMTARQVLKDLTRWLEPRPEVTSADIRRKAAEYLYIYNQDAAYLYKRQRTIG